MKALVHSEGPAHPATSHQSTASSSAFYEVKHVAARRPATRLSSFQPVKDWYIHTDPHFAEYAGIRPCDGRSLLYVSIWVSLRLTAIRLDSTGGALKVAFDGKRLITVIAALDAATPHANDFRDGARSERPRSIPEEQPTSLPSIPKLARRLILYDLGHGCRLVSAVAHMSM